MSDEAAPSSAADADAVVPTDRTGSLRYGFDALQDGRREDAERAARPFAGPDDIEHAMLLGLAIGLRGDTPEVVAEAGDWFAMVADERPAMAHPVDDLARLLREQKREGEALAHAEQVVRLRPDDHRTHGTLGIQLITALRPAEAEIVLRRAVALAPRNFGHINQLGISLIDQGLQREANEQFRIAVAIEPDNNVGWTNLGCTLANEGHFDEALTYYRRAILLKPEAPAVRVNHAICLLKAGRMMQGWAEYEWRLRTPGHTELPLDRMLPNLAPDQRLDGMIVLVTQEEGLGDTLQFMRYLAPLRDRGAEVVAWVPEPLRALIAQIPGIRSVSGNIDTLEFSRHCPFISLPRAFSATPQALPTEPYIRVDPAHAARMGAHLPQGDALKVGLVWGGAPRPENRGAFSVDRRRSMGGGLLSMLRAVPNARFVSLQMGPYRRDLRDLAPGLSIDDPMDASVDMHDTAALISGLDVVVSVDTSVVHLAAGMGKPTILLDRYDNCWRWLYGRDDSPYYPSLRLIRQTRPRDWAGSMERLVAALRILSDDKRRGRPIGVHRAINAISRFGTVVPEFPIAA